MVKRLVKFLILAGVLVGVAIWGYNAVINREININKWFTSGQTLGVDVSSYQEDVDFKKLREQGIEFAYIKATEGTSHIDSSFEKKWTDTSSAGVFAGAYHFFSYGESGAAQAENFIKVVGELSSERLIPAVDMELSTYEVMHPPEVADVVRGLKAFLAVVEEKYGVKPLIYAQKDYYDKYLAADFADYPRWARNVFYPVMIDMGDDWAVWQYHDKGELEGYSGEKYIDMNVVNSRIGLDGLKYNNRT